ncbi:MAG: hypothetical protein JWO45_151, partial [Spartobacteria bacterium]|nr:hypothetical protein [Spartobacteria bacterium]
MLGGGLARARAGGQKGDAKQTGNG